MNKNLTPAEYQAVHKWVAQKLGKANKCNHCNKFKTKYEWANISKEYKYDFSDWISLCTSCHQKYDYRKETGEKISKALTGIKREYFWKRVIQLTKSGKYVKEWDNIGAASRKMGILPTSISNMLSGRSKTAGGYIWQAT